MAHARHLNVGSGTDHKQSTDSVEWVNVDIDARLEPDVVHDLDDHPWPFPDNHFDQVLALDVLEHLADPLGAAREAHRILRPGGELRVRVPHYRSPDYRRDWSHNNGPWCEERLQWIADPSGYVSGLSFELVRVSTVKPWTFLFDVSLWSKWWRWGRYGNVEAVYRAVEVPEKEGVVTGHVAPASTGARA